MKNGMRSATRCVQRDAVQRGSIAARCGAALCGAVRYDQLYAAYSEVQRGVVRRRSRMGSGVPQCDAMRCGALRLVVRSLCTRQTLL